MLLQLQLLQGASVRRGVYVCSSSGGMDAHACERGRCGPACRAQWPSLDTRAIWQGAAKKTGRRDKAIRQPARRTTVAPSQRSSMQGTRQKAGGLARVLQLKQQLQQLADVPARRERTDAVVRLCKDLSAAFVGVDAVSADTLVQQHKLPLLLARLARQQLEQSLSQVVSAPAAPGAVPRWLAPPAVIAAGGAVEVLYATAHFAGLWRRLSDGAAVEAARQLGQLAAASGAGAAAGHLAGWRAHSRHAAVSRQHAAATPPCSVHCSAARRRCGWFHHMFVTWPAECADERPLLGAGGREWCDRAGQ